MILIIFKLSEAGDWKGSYYYQILTPKAKFCNTVRMNVQREVGGRQVQQALQLQTQGQDGDQETCSDDKREVAGYQVLPTKVRACTDWSLPKTVRPPRGR